MIGSTDRIEKRVLLRAPLERVWRAISDSQEFGAWFGVEFGGGFAEKTRMAAKIVPTKADPAVAQTLEDYTGVPIEFYVERIEPMRLFSFRWHPFALDRDVDYSDEAMTLVAFTLEACGDGTMLTIVESGFDGIPIERRADAFEANDEGWQIQSELIGKHLALQG